VDELRSRIGGGLAPHLPVSLHAPKSRPRLARYTRTGRYLPGRSELATRRCLKYSPPQFVRAQVGVSSLAVTSQCCSFCATPMRSGPWCHTAARQTFPSLGPREYSISQWDWIGHGPSRSTSTSAVLHLLVCGCRVGVKFRFTLPKEVPGTVFCV
jgi:hypothetical protein